MTAVAARSIRGVPKSSLVSALTWGFTGAPPGIRTRGLRVRCSRILAWAWQDETAWAGLARAGGVDLPGEVAAQVAINEVVVHDWDIAAATRHEYACQTELVQAAYAFARSAVAQNPDGSPGLFGPPVSVPDSAPLLDRLLGLTGRDPAWRLGGGH